MLKNLIAYFSRKGNNYVRRTCPEAVVLDGLAIKSGSVNRADKDIENWLKRIHIGEKQNG